MPLIVPVDANHAYIKRVLSLRTAAMINKMTTYAKHFEVTPKKIEQAQ